MHIPPQNMEIEGIYTQLLGAKNRTITICSANHGEGVTSVALALAQRYLLAGHATLLVDLNLYQPSLNKLLTLDETASLPDLKTDVFGNPELVSGQGQSVALIGITCPTRRDLIIKLRKPGLLEQYIVDWQKSFDTIIFDTSPINRINASNIPAERVAAACDGSLLIVLAGSTTEAMVSSAVNKLKIAGANLVGCVFNDRDSPTLKNELLRETVRLESRFAGLARYITGLIRKSHLLSTEI